MKVLNSSKLATRLFRGVVDDQQIHATLVARATYQVRAGRCELLQPPEEVRAEDVELDGVQLDGDWAPVKSGVDVVVLGNGYPRPAPATSLRVRIRIGATEVPLLAFGDREWRANPSVDFRRACSRALEGEFDHSALVATAPQPFDRLPMTWARAFGGQAPYGGAKVPYAANPLGRGFLMFLDEAPGTLLPNWEDPGQPIAHWRDWPLPACFAPCPRTSKLRVDRGVLVAADSATFSLRPGYFCMAHPWLVLHELLPDTEVDIEGMRPEGRFNCRLPAPDFKVRVDVGRKHLMLPLTLDTIELYPERQRVSVVLRKSFRYYLHPGDARQATVFEGRGSA